MKPIGGWVTEFQETFEVDQTECRRIAWKLLREELVEVKAALDAGNRVDIARELADLVYVAYGTAWAHDIWLDDAIEEVHRANMAKMPASGKPLKTPEGKILKPEGWQIPSMTKAITRRKPVVMPDAD